MSELGNTAAVKKKPATKASFEKKKAAVIKKLAAGKEKLAAKGGEKKPPRSAKQKTSVSTVGLVAKPQLTVPAHETGKKLTRDLEKGVTPMASSNCDLEDEGFGFFTDDDESPAAAATDSNVEVIDLGSSLTNKNVEEWYGRLENALSGANSIKLEAGALDQIDGTGLQLLCSLVKSAKVIELSICWGETSTRFLQSADYFGASKVLGIDSEKIAA